MSTIALILVNLGASLLTILAVLALVRLAHRLPAHAPHDDATWGRGGDPWVVSDPLPLAQLAAHETRRDLVRAA
jgi:hypothetical protein